MKPEISKLKSLSCCDAQRGLIPLKGGFDPFKVERISAQLRCSG